MRADRRQHAIDTGAPRPGLCLSRVGTPLSLAFHRHGPTLRRLFVDQGASIRTGQVPAAAVGTSQHACSLRLAWRMHCGGVVLHARGQEQSQVVFEPAKKCCCRRLPTNVCRAGSRSVWKQAACGPLCRVWSCFHRFLTVFSSRSEAPRPEPAAHQQQTRPWRRVGMGWRCGGACPPASVREASW